MSLADHSAWIVCASLAAIPLGPGEARSQQRVTDQCMICHLSLAEIDLVEPAARWPSDVHFAAGLACTGCHGGDARSVVETTAHAGMVASPARERVPAMCGRCHSRQEFMRTYDPDIRIDQVEAYYTSRHGELLACGDGKVATCIDCLSTHGIQSASTAGSPVHPANVPETCGSCHADEERMAGYDVPTDQLEEYRSSIHWAVLEEQGDLSAPVCNDCHGNHGAVPPGHSAVGRVCAECHFQIGEYYGMSAHDSVFNGLDRPGCATCHGNHAIQTADDELLGLGERSTCTGSGCHSASDEGGQAAREMLALVASLHTAHTRADSILRQAEHTGMPVDQALFELRQVQNAIVSARAVMHTAKIDSVRAHIAEGLEAAATGYRAGEDAFEELSVRRTGLAASAVVIMVLVFGLLIKIRQLGSA
jgi:hypothetical protein